MKYEVNFQCFACVNVTSPLWQYAAKRCQVCRHCYRWCHHYYYSHWSHSLKCKSDTDTIIVIMIILFVLQVWCLLKNQLIYCFLGNWYCLKQWKSSEGKKHFTNMCSGSTTTVTDHFYIFLHYIIHYILCCLLCNNFLPRLHCIHTQSTKTAKILNSIFKDWKRRCFYHCYCSFFSNSKLQDHLSCRIHDILSIYTSSKGMQLTEAAICDQWSHHAACLHACFNAQVVQTW